MHRCMCPMYAQWPYKTEKDVRPLEMMLETGMSCHVCAKDWTQVHFKSGKHSVLPSFSITFKDIV